VHLTSGSITVAVDRMEAKGLVQRCNHPSDRRARVVHLTEAGEKLIRCAFADHEAAMERVFEVLAMVGDKPDRPDAIDAPPVVDEIRFEDVEFEYRDRTSGALPLQ